MEFETTELMFLCTLVKARLAEIDQFHAEHPNLPRQDDVKHVYTVLYGKLNSALPEHLRESW